MAILLALLSAASYGTSDFCAGLASRRWAAGAVSGLVIATEVVCAAIAVVLIGGDGPSVRAIAWGAASGLGSGIGTVSLYRGFAAGAMTVVGTLSGVIAAVVPVIVGLALGDHLSVGGAIGIVIAVPSIALVSWQPRAGDRPKTRTAAGFGLLAGSGFALLFIALQRAGTRAGAWPILPGQLVGLGVVSRSAAGAVRGAGPPGIADALLGIGAGVLAGAAALLYLLATGHGQLSIVAVVAALYPAFTVLLARTVLSERWSRAQAAGLIVAAASIILVSVS